MQRLRSLNDPIDLDEVRRIYLSLSRLLSAHVEVVAAPVPPAQALPRASSDDRRRPSSSASPARWRSASRPPPVSSKELLSRWPSSPKVDLVTTDGFLHPNAVLQRENMMDRKGFPESYDIGALLRFLSAIKAGQPNVKAPTLLAPDL